MIGQRSLVRRLFGRVRRKFEALLASLSWSNLAIYGNSPITRLVALAPVVAWVIRLQDTLLEKYFHFEQWVWLYWSLMAIFIAQAIYFLRCPSIIKKYGSDRERHTIESLSALPSREVVELQYRWIRSLYLTKKIRLGLERHDDNLREKLRMEASTNGGPLSPSTVDALVIGYENLCDILESPSKIYPRQINFAVLRDLAVRCPIIVFGEGVAHLRPEATQLKEIFRLSIPVKGEPSGDWKVDALDWRYSSHNSSRPLSRGVAAVFYAAGSIYFGVRFILGVTEMIPMIPSLFSTGS